MGLNQDEVLKKLILQFETACSINSQNLEVVSRGIRKNSREKSQKTAFTWDDSLNRPNVLAKSFAKKTSASITCQNNLHAFFDFIKIVIFKLEIVNCTLQPLHERYRFQAVDEKPIQRKLSKTSLGKETSLGKIAKL